MDDNNSYWQRVFFHRISRRRILRSAAVGGLGVAAAAVIGCGEEDKPPTQGISATSTATAAPSVQATATASSEQARYGGILRTTTGTLGDPPNFDIHQHTTTAVLLTVGPTYNKLARWDPLATDPKIVPDVAQSWEQPEPTVIVFRLQPDVKFHHGKVLHSEDVTISIEHQSNPPEGSVSPRQELLTPIERVEVIDPITLRLVTKRPWAAGLGQLSSDYNSIYPKDVLVQKGHMKEDIVGTGPFKFQQYVRGNSFELVKNADYFRAGRPYLDGVKVFIIPDVVTGFAAFQAHELDIGGVSSADQREFVLKNMANDVTAQPTINWGWSLLTVDTRREPMNDTRVIRALSLAIDRKAGIDLVNDREGTLGSALHPQERWHMPLEELAEIPGYGPNAEENRELAKQLLAEAGLPTGLSIQGIARRVLNGEKFPEFLADKWARVGVRLEFTLLESATFYDRAYAWDYGDFLHLAVGNASGDPDVLFGQYWITSGARNFPRLNIREVDDLYDKQSQELNVDERTRLAQRMDRVLIENYPLAVPWWPSGGYVFHWNNVRNFVAQPGNNFNNVSHENTWLAG